MNKYSHYGYYILTPLLLFSPIMMLFGETMSNKVEATTISNDQAEIHFGSNEKKVSNKPVVKIKKSHNNTVVNYGRAREPTKHGNKKTILEISRIVIDLEHQSNEIDIKGDESILGKVLANFSGTVLYGVPQKNI